LLLSFSLHPQVLVLLCLAHCAPTAIPKPLRTPRFLTHSNVAIRLVVSRTQFLAVKDGLEEYAGLFATTEPREVLVVHLLLFALLVYPVAVLVASPRPRANAVDLLLFAILLKVVAVLLATPLPQTDAVLIRLFAA